MTGSGPRIAVLDPVVANQIAAGEVVERPASVVKELVENALDAGATRIDVTIEDGGRRLIRVRDNGHGMGQEDAILCLQRHATSKIRTSDDLHNIRTLGFRGEALPSIASVSQFRMLTRPSDSSQGVEVVVEGGAVTEFNVIGCPVGTDIRVSNLFFNVPARLKFLKTAATEMDHITGFLSAVCLLHDQVSFRLDHNGRTVLSVPACGDLLGAMAGVFGADLARETVPVDLELGGVRVSGRLGLPAAARAQRTHQLFYVNGRPVRNRALTHALYDGYHTLLMTGRHPVAVVMVEADPREVDVNVHPAKNEVRFTREWEIHNLVRKAVREALEAAQLVATSSAPMPPGTLTDSAVSADAEQTATLPGIEGGEWASTSSVAPVVEAVELGGDRGSRFPARIRPLGQIANTYLICDTDEGMLVVDQHALHERILYEQLSQAEAERGVSRQLLAVPLPLHLSPREAQAVNSNLETLSSLGFDLEPFGGDSFLVRSVPTVVAYRNHDQLLRDVVDDLVAYGDARSYHHHRDFVLRTMACKAAVKAGDALAPEEMRELLRQMRDADIPLHCNHGRPTMFTITTEALEKRFERT